MIETMHGLCTGSCLAQAQQSSLDLQVRAVLYASGLLLVTNVVLVGWLVAMRGGRLAVATVSRQPEPALETREPRRSRVDDVRLLAAIGLLGTAHVHAAMIPVRLGSWPAAAGFFLLHGGRGRRRRRTAAGPPGPRCVTGRRRGLHRPDRAVPVLVHRRAAVSGPAPACPRSSPSRVLVGFALEIASLLAVGWLLRDTPARRRRPAASAHLRGLVLAAVVAVTVIGLAGTVPAWFDQPGDSGPRRICTTTMLLGCDSGRYASLRPHHRPLPHPTRSRPSPQTV